nr:GAF domain-containing protein [Tanacetum cinerariifolium]
ANAGVNARKLSKTHESCKKRAEGDENAWKLTKTRRCRRKCANAGEKARMPTKTRESRRKRANANERGHVSFVDVVDIDELCLHDLKEMIVKVGYGVAHLLYYHFLIPRLGLDYGLHPLTLDVDVLELAKYDKDNKIILVYVEHGSTNVDSSIFVTLKKGVVIAVDNHLRKAPIKIDSSPNVGPMGNFKEVNVDTYNKTEEKGVESDTEENDTSGNDSKDLYYDLKHDELFDDDKHILDVSLSMNNFYFNPDHKHDLSIAVVEVHKDDIDVIDYDSFGSDLC